MTNDNLPATEGPPSFDVPGGGAPQFRIDSIILRPNHNRGLWSFGGVDMDGGVEMVMIGAHEWRRRFNLDRYKAGADQFPVCRSMNGVDGYGIGDADFDDNRWRDLVSKQQCRDEDGRPICKVGFGDRWLCRPNLNILCLVMFAGEDTWKFAIYEAVKRAHTLAERHWGMVQRKSLATYDGELRRPTHPTWFFSSTVTLTNTAGKAGWIPQFGRIEELTQPDVGEVHEMVTTAGPAVWKAHLQAQQNAVDAVGREELPDGD